MTREIDEAPQVKHVAMNEVLGNKYIYSVSQRKRDREEQRASKQGVIIIVRGPRS